MSERSPSPSRSLKRKREDSVGARTDEPKRPKIADTHVDGEVDTPPQHTHSNSSRIPVSLEDLLKQKQEQQSQENKPVFLTKAQRRELALKKRQEEALAQREMRETSMAAIQAGHPSAPPPPRRDRDYDQYNDRGRVESSRRSRRESSRSRSRSRGRRDRDRDRDRYGDRDSARDRTSDRDRYRSSSRRSRSRSPRQHRDEMQNGDSSRSDKLGDIQFEIDPQKLEEERRKELEAIRLEKLGLKPKHKRQVTAADKNKFRFDWDASEDTAANADYLYTDRVGLKPRTGGSAASALLPSSGEDRTHWSAKKEADMTARDWRIFREDNKIQTKGGNIPNPIRSWKEATSLPRWLIEAIEDAKYEKPTPVQMQAIPIGLSGRDIIGLAETGSGKTAAFVIPMLCYIDTKPPLSHEQDGPYALIMAPARELAIQIDEEVKKFCRRKGYRSVCLIGGVPIEEQSLELRKGCEIVVATPGRLIEAIDSRYVSLEHCNYVVLDEADRMIDMGFEPQLLKILDAMPKSAMKSENEEEAQRQENDRRSDFRHTIMFSATMPPPVERIAQLYLRHPARVIIGEVGKAVDRITQTVIWVRNEGDKRKRLDNLITQTPPPVIVFVNQKKTADFVAKQINASGKSLQAAPLHSARSQEQREMALDQFRRGEVQVLVATDVAGRGLDVKGIKHVINFDMPKTIEDYTHRIGRTGRAGEHGLASSFLTSDDVEIMYDLKQMLVKTRSVIPRELSDHPASHSKPTAGAPMSKRDAAPITM